MAKGTKTVAPALNLGLLATIAAATAAGGFHYVSQADGQPLVEAGLIEVNTAMVNDNGEAAARVTEAGAAKVGAGEQSPAPVQASSGFQIITGVELPKFTRKGGGGGQKAKYPFEQLEVGASFFVANTDVESGDAYKSLNASVANWNEKFKEETGETKTVTRAVRGEGRKAVKNPDGTNQMETVTVAVKRSLRKFTARAVTGGKAYGSYTAPADGVLVSRTA